MKFYTIPEATVINISSEDIMTSSPLSDGGLYDEISNNIDYSEILDALGK